MKSGILDAQIVKETKKKKNSCLLSLKFKEGTEILRVYTNGDIEPKATFELSDGKSVQDVGMVCGKYDFMPEVLLSLRTPVPWLRALQFSESVYDVFPGLLNGEECGIYAEQYPENGYTAVTIGEYTLYMYVNGNKRPALSWFAHAPIERAVLTKR